MTATIANERWDARRFTTYVEKEVSDWRWSPGDLSRMRVCIPELTTALDAMAGSTVQDRWLAFEVALWPQWSATAGERHGKRWRWSTWAAVMTRAIRPTWAWVSTGRVEPWIDKLPPHDPLRVARDRMLALTRQLPWIDPTVLRRPAVLLGLRLLLAHGLEHLEDLTDDHLHGAQKANGMEALDAALCASGVVNRPPMRGSTRRSRREQIPPSELVDIAHVPQRFRDVTVRYLEEYNTRIAPAYSTLRSKAISLGHWWEYIDRTFPDIRSSADIRPRHARGFIEWVKEHGKAARRRSAHDEDATHERLTPYRWAGAVNVFFQDLMSWATEDDSPLAGYAPPSNPLVRRDLVALQPVKIKRQTEARVAATVLELERGLPMIRAYAVRRWQNENASPSPVRRQLTRIVSGDQSAFWDWALLEILVLSGVRVEEACELTTLDVLRRQLPDGRRYYLLHIKPSKYDRARVIPIGDGLGRVIAEIVRRVRTFYRADAVPAVRAWDSAERRWRPAAPYLLQTATGHPSVIADDTIRERLARLSKAAGVTRSDGRPLVLRPHDCRRMFASDHLNNSTPPHVLQALLGHATIDTVLVYAKLYPTTLVEEYRKTLHGVYQARYGTEAFKNPTAEEWAAMNLACEMRDVGTHLCALPTGEHCPKGLVCLGCSHAQPKKSAVPVFRGMLASHLRVLNQARDTGEPAGQIAARELEVERIRGALRRAEELSADVAAAIDASSS
jgi:site-specific recombinase XerD